MALRPNTVPGAGPGKGAAMRQAELLPPGFLAGLLTKPIREMGRPTQSTPSKALAAKLTDGLLTSVVQSTAATRSAARCVNPSVPRSSSSTAPVQMSPQRQEPSSEAQPSGQPPRSLDAAAMPTEPHVAASRSGTPAGGRGNGSLNMEVLTPIQPDQASGTSPGSELSPLWPPSVSASRDTGCTGGSAATAVAGVDAQSVSSELEDEQDMLRGALMRSQGDTARGGNHSTSLGFSSSNETSSGVAMEASAPARPSEAHAVSPPSSATLAAEGVGRDDEEEEEAGERPGALSSAPNVGESGSLTTPRRRSLDKSSDAEAGCKSPLNDEVQQLQASVDTLKAKLRSSDQEKHKLSGDLLEARRLTWEHKRAADQARHSLREVIVGAEGENIAPEDLLDPEGVMEPDYLDLDAHDQHGDGQVELSSPSRRPHSVPASPATAADLERAAQMRKLSVRELIEEREGQLHQVCSALAEARAFAGMCWRAAEERLQVVRQLEMREAQRTVIAAAARHPAGDVFFGTTLPGIDAYAPRDPVPTSAELAANPGSSGGEDAEVFGENPTRMLPGDSLEAPHPDLSSPWHPGAIVDIGNSPASAPPLGPSVVNLPITDALAASVSSGRTGSHSRYSRPALEPELGSVREATNERATTDEEDFVEMQMESLAHEEAVYEDTSEAPHPALDALDQRPNPARPGTASRRGRERPKVKNPAKMRLASEGFAACVNRLLLKAPFQNLKSWASNETSRLAVLGLQGALERRAVEQLEPKASAPKTSTATAAPPPVVPVDGFSEAPSVPKASTATAAPPPAVPVDVFSERPSPGRPAPTAPVQAATELPAAATKVSPALAVHTPASTFPAKVAAKADCSVFLSFALENVDYSLLHANEDLLGDVTLALKQCISRESGGMSAGIMTGQVGLELSSGSLLVTANVNLKNKATADSVRSKLEASETLSDSVVASVMGVPDIESVTTACVSIGYIKVAATLEAERQAEETPPVAPVPQSFSDSAADGCDLLSRVDATQQAERQAEETPPVAPVPQSFSDSAADGCDLLSYVDATQQEPPRPSDQASSATVGRPASANGRPASAKTLRIQKLEDQVKALLSRQDLEEAEKAAVEAVKAAEKATTLEAALLQQSMFLQQSALSAEALMETTQRLEVAIADTAAMASPKTPATPPPAPQRTVSKPVALVAASTQVSRPPSKSPTRQPSSPPVASVAASTQVSRPPSKLATRQPSEASSPPVASVAASTQVSRPPSKLPTRHPSEQSSPPVGPVAAPSQTSAPASGHQSTQPSRAERMPPPAVVEPLQELPLLPEARQDPLPRSLSFARRPMSANAAIGRHGGGPDSAGGMSPTTFSAEKQAQRNALLREPLVSRKVAQTGQAVMGGAIGSRCEHLAACGVLRARLAPLLEPTETVDKAFAIDRLKALVGEHYALLCMQSKVKCFNARRMVADLQQNTTLKQRFKNRNHGRSQSTGSSSGATGSSTSHIRQLLILETQQASNDSAADTSADQIGAIDSEPIAVAQTSGIRPNIRTGHQKKQRAGRGGAPQVERPASVPALALDRVKFGEPIPKGGVKAVKVLDDKDAVRVAMQVLNSSLGDTINPHALTAMNYDLPEVAAPMPMLVSNLSSAPAPEALDRFVEERMQEKNPDQETQSHSDSQLPGLSKGGTKEKAARRGVSSAGGTKQRPRKADPRPGRTPPQCTSTTVALEGAAPFDHWKALQTSPLERPVCSPPPKKAVPDWMKLGNAGESKALEWLLTTKAKTTYEWPPMSKECHGHRPSTAPSRAPAPLKALTAGPGSMSAGHIVYPLRPGQVTSATACNLDIASFVGEPLSKSGGTISMEPHAGLVGFGIATNSRPGSRPGSGSRTPVQPLVRT